MVGLLASALDADRTELEATASYVPGEFAEVIAQRPEVRELLNLATASRQSNHFYRKLKDMLDDEGVINVPVWLE